MLQQAKVISLDRFPPPEGERAQRKTELKQALQFARNQGFGVLFNQLKRHEGHWAKVRSALNEAVIAFIEDAYVADEDTFPADAVKEYMLDSLAEDLDFILRENKAHFEQMHQNSREELIGYGLMEDLEEEEKEYAAECAAQRRQEQLLLKQINYIPHAQ